MKRNEENMKFIFKFIMKEIQENLQIKQDELYERFFGLISKQKGIPLSTYQDPIQKKNPKYKSLSKEYLLALFESNEFKEIFQRFLSPEHILNSYSQKLKRKLTGILKRFFSINSEINQETLQDYFQSNKQCKLPWRVREIEEAIQFFLNILK